MIGRRTFLVAAAGTVFPAPWSARAQNSTRREVGFLNGASRRGSEQLAVAFRQGLAETGYRDGHELTIDYRWTEGHPKRAPALVDELVKRRVALIAVGGGSAVRLAAKAATTTIPIVFVTGSDPVNEGLIANLSRPAGNITGIVVPTTSLNAKRLELLHELVPTATTIAVLANPTVSWTEQRAAELRTAAEAMARRIHVVSASTEAEIEAAMAGLARSGATALLITADPFFNAQTRQLVELTRRHRIPAMFEWREFATAGGLVSYGSDIANGYREAGVYAGRILGGARPSDLPVKQATKYELVVNLKTANALGLTIPQRFLMRADEVLQ